MRIVLLTLVVSINTVCFAQISMEKIESFLIESYIMKGLENKISLSTPDCIYLDSNKIKVTSDTLLSVKFFVEVSYIKDTLGGHLYEFNRLGEYCVGPYGVEDSLLSFETLSEVYLGSYFFDFGVLNKYNSGYVLVAKDGKIQILSSLILDVSKAYYSKLKIDNQAKIELMTYKYNAILKRRLFSWDVQINEDLFKVRIKDNRPILNVR